MSDVKVYCANITPSRGDCKLQFSGVGSESGYELEISGLSHYDVFNMLIYNGDVESIMSAYSDRVDEFSKIPKGKKKESLNCILNMIGTIGNVGLPNGLISCMDRIKNAILREIDA